MTGLEVLALLQLWIPILTGVGMIYKAYRTARAGITKWADQLLNNHLHHIELALIQISVNSKLQTQVLRGLARDLRSSFPDGVYTEPSE